MRTTRAGFTDEDFYGSNDTDVVHFRYLHKLLRQVPTMTLSDVNDGKFTQYVAHDAAASKYGSNTYKTTVATMTADHKVSDHVFNPFIDDQLDRHYQDVVKPQVDRLDGRCDALDGRCDDLLAKYNTLKGEHDDLYVRHQDLVGKFNEQSKTLAALEKRLAALENPAPTK